MNDRWNVAEEVVLQHPQSGVVFAGNDSEALKHIIRAWGSRVQKVYVSEESRQGKVTLALAQKFKISGVTIGKPEDLDRELERISDIPLIGICSNFSRISLPSLTAPLLGFINLHPAPLPEYGGKTPWHHMRIEHHQVAACVAHEMEMRFDSGRQICRLERPLPYDWDFNLMRCTTEELAGLILSDALSPESLGASLRRAYLEDRYLNSRIWPGVRGPVLVDFRAAPDQVFAHIRTQETFGGYPARTDRASGKLFALTLSKATFDERLVGCVLQPFDADLLDIGLRDQFVLQVRVDTISGVWRPGDRISADVPLMAEQ